MGHRITEKRIEEFGRYLEENEKAASTVSRYMKEVQDFAAFLEGRAPEKTLLLEYRSRLHLRCRARTVNRKLSAIHSYLKYTDCADCRVKFLKVQKKAFLEDNRELTPEEYSRLLETAKRKGNWRLYYVMMTICSTGIRIGELRYITAEAVRKGRAEIALKGKVRLILIPRELQMRLEGYMRKERITSGPVFCSRYGNPLDRSNVCREMKNLCEAAGISAQKVFPHNLRHLFARSFYQVEKDLAHLADVMGHSSIETTRIYVTASARDYECTLNRMHLIL